MYMSIIFSSMATLKDKDNFIQTFLNSKVPTIISKLSVQRDLWNLNESENIASLWHMYLQLTKIISKTGHFYLLDHVLREKSGGEIITSD